MDRFVSGAILQIEDCAQNSSDGIDSEEEKLPPSFLELADVHYDASTSKKERYKVSLQICCAYFSNICIC